MQLDHPVTHSYQLDAEFPVIPSLGLFNNQPVSNPTRRRLLRLAGASALALALPKPAWSQADILKSEGFWLVPRTLNYRNLQGQRLKVTYWEDGIVQKSAYDEINWFMRDRKASQEYVKPMDLRLLDAQYAVGGWLRHFGLSDLMRFHYGARDPSRAKSIEGASLTSKHHDGRAIDAGIDGVPNEKYASFGVWLRPGGIGFYQSKDFTHMDTGPLRAWRG